MVIHNFKSDLPLGMYLFSVFTKQTSIVIYKLDDLVGAKESLVAIVVVIRTEGDRHFVAK